MDELTKIKVTIVIPSYNSANFISKTLDSVLSQNYSNFELIVVDDGSTDTTPDVVGLYCQKDNRINLTMKENGGVSSARNRGIDLARGEYICFLDSDDIIEPNFLSLMVEKIESAKTDLTYCGYIKHELKSLDRFPKEFTSELPLKNYIVERISFGIGSFIVKKEFLNKNNIRFSEKIRLSEDVLFIYTMLSLGTVSYVDQYLFHYILRRNSVMNSQWKKETYVQDIQALEYINEYMKDLNLDDEINETLRVNLVKRKIRLLWKLLLARKFSDLNEYIHGGFLNDNEILLLGKCDKKTTKRYKYIFAKNKFLWFLISIINNRKDKI